MCDEAAKILSSFSPVKLYASGFFGLRATSLTTRNINAAINDGAGFVLFSMHGSPTLLATYPPFNKARNIPVPFPSGYDISNVENLMNGDKLPVTVFSACSCGNFDENPSPIAWEFVQHDGGGSIASFALTTDGNIWPTTMYTESLSGFTTMVVFEAYRDGITCIGDIWGETIKRYMDDDVAWSINDGTFSDETGKPIIFDNYLALQEWILLGDPSLKIGGYA